MLSLSSKKILRKYILGVQVWHHALYVFSSIGTKGKSIFFLIADFCTEREIQILFNRNVFIMYFLKSDVSSLGMKKKSSGTVFWSN